MKNIIVMSTIGLVLVACQASNKNDFGDAEKIQIKADILTLLDAQDAAWSAGDIDSFMQSYWKSPDLRFASGGNIQRGWEGTKARYKKRYPTPDIMGDLSTGDHEFDIINESVAVVHGSWALKRDNVPVSGLYTLIFKKIDGGWVITSDTTTSAQ